MLPEEIYDYKTKIAEKKGITDKRHIRDCDLLAEVTQISENPRYEYYDDLPDINDNTTSGINLNYLLIASLLINGAFGIKMISNSIKKKRKKRKNQQKEEPEI